MPKKNLTATLLNGDVPSKEPVSPHILDLVNRAYAISCRQDKLKKELDGIKDQLKTELGTGVSVVINGLCRATLVTSPRVSITDPEKLEKLLGVEFETLVKAKYSKTDALLERAEQDVKINNCLKTVNSTALRLTAEKPEK